MKKILESWLCKQNKQHAGLLAMLPSSIVHAASVFCICKLHSNSWFLVAPSPRMPQSDSKMVILFVRLPICHSDLFLRISWNVRKMWAEITAFCHVLRLHSYVLILCKFSDFFWWTCWFLQLNLHIYVRFFIFLLNFYWPVFNCQHRKEFTWPCYIVSTNAHECDMMGFNWGYQFSCHCSGWDFEERRWTHPAEGSPLNSHISNLSHKMSGLQVSLVRIRFA